MNDDISTEALTAIEEAWDQEAERRYNEFLAGKISAIPAELVLMELKNKYPVSVRRSPGH
jgi:hypothetical protein